MNVVKVVTIALVIPDNKTVAEALADKFIGWPLPKSVCADLCATKYGEEGRSGTNLLTWAEAKQMFEALLGD